MRSVYYAQGYEDDVPQAQGTHQDPVLDGRLVCWRGRDKWKHNDPAGHDEATRYKRAFPMKTKDEPKIYIDTLVRLLNSQFDKEGYKVRVRHADGGGESVTLIVKVCAPSLAL
jgi:hypothetical protein